MSSRTGAAPGTRTSGFGIKLPGLTREPGRPGSRQVPGWRAPAFSRGVAVAARASRTGGMRTAAVSATRRTAAARSWPPVIAQPIMTAFFTIARACGRALRVIAVQQVLLAPAGQYMRDLPCQVVGVAQPGRQGPGR